MLTRKSKIPPEILRALMEMPKLVRMVCPKKENKRRTVVAIKVLLIATAILCFEDKLPEMAPKTTPTPIGSITAKKVVIDKIKTSKGMSDKNDI